MPAQPPWTNIPGSGAFDTRESVKRQHEESVEEQGSRKRARLVNENTEEDDNMAAQFLLNLLFWTLESVMNGSHDMSTEGGVFGRKLLDIYLLPLADDAMKIVQPNGTPYPLPSRS